MLSQLFKILLKSSSYNNVCSDPKFLYSPIQNPCHFLVIFFHRNIPRLFPVIFLIKKYWIFTLVPIHIFCHKKNDKIRYLTSFEKIHNLMARFARGGFVGGSTGISSQNIHYYNYSDIVIF